MSCSLQEALKKHEVFARARGFTAPTIEHTGRCVALFNVFLGGSKDVDEIAVSAFRLFVADLRERPARNVGLSGRTRKLSGTTVNTYARAIRAFFSWMKTEGLIAANPLASEPAPKKPRTIPTVYAEEELRAFFGLVARDLRNKAIIFFFVDSGLRLSELSELTIDRIDTREGKARVMGKGQKERMVPFHRDVAAAIDEYINKGRPVPKGTDRLFLTDEGTPLSARGMQSMLARLGREAGVAERLAPHKLRHSCATYSLKYGGNLEYIKIILGHSDIKTTSGAYLNADFTDVKAAHDKFSPLSNLLGQSRSGSLESQRDLEGRAEPKLNDAAAPGQAGTENANQSVSPEQDTGTSEAESAKSSERSGTWEAGLRPIYRGLYMEHLRRLATLAGELAADIEKDNLERRRNPPRANPKSAFSGVDLAKVYHAQNSRLWPSLSQHLDNEFNKPRLTAQIAQTAVNRLVKGFGKERPEASETAEAVIEKLAMASERGTFEGTCDICRSYFVPPG